MAGFFDKIFGTGDQGQPGSAEETRSFEAASAEDKGQPATTRKTTAVTPEESVTLPPALYSAMALLKGRQPSNNRAPKLALASVFPITAEMVHEEGVREAARLKAEEEAAKTLQIGKLVPGKGVYLGIWAPKDRDGRSLNKTFNLFAAPHDLGLNENGQGSKLVKTYNDAVKAVAKIRDLMGHNGANYANDTELYNALRSRSYKGEWFIPTRDILHGKDKDGNQVQNDHLYGHKDTGSLRGTYTTQSSGTALWYWSCTEPPVYPSYVYVVRFSDGDVDWDHKDNNELSCRPVRAELKSSFSIL